MSPLRWLIGRWVRYEYSTPAVSCYSSYRRAVEGKVTSIRHNPTEFFGRDTLIVRTSDGASAYVTRKEITHLKDRVNRWRIVKPDALLSQRSKGEV